MRPRRALAALTSLAACAAPLPPPSAPAAAPTLAEVVAPERVRPELEAPLSALLGGDRSDLLLTVGDETVRCQVAVEPGGSRATCDGIVVPGETLAALVRQLHRGDWRQRLVQARLEDPVRFSARTGFELDPDDPGSENNPYPPPEVAHYLGDPLRWTRFAAGERGETVSATFKVPLVSPVAEGTEPVETIEAGSLFALAQRLRARQAELLAEREAHSAFTGDQIGIDYLLRQAWQASPGHWSLQHIVPGQTRPGQLRTGDTRLEPLPAGSSGWDPSRQGVPVVVTERQASGRSRTPLDGVVVQASVFMGRGRHDSPVDCAGHDGWLAARSPPLARIDPGTAAACHWRWSSADHRLDLVITATHLRLSVTWQPARFEQTAHEASAVVPAPRAHRRMRGYEEPLAPRASQRARTRATWGVGAGPFMLSFA